MKVAQLRNLYQRVGMFGMASTFYFGIQDEPFLGPQIRGFGFTHDGTVDTMFRFLNGVVFPNIQGQAIAVFDGVSDSPVVFELTTTNDPLINDAIISAVNPLFTLPECPNISGILQMVVSG